MWELYIRYRLKVEPSPDALYKQDRPLWRTYLRSYFPSFCFGQCCAMPLAPPFEEWWPTLPWICTRAIACERQARKTQEPLEGATYIDGLLTWLVSFLYKVTITWTRNLVDSLTATNFHLWIAVAAEPHDVLCINTHPSRHTDPVTVDQYPDVKVM